MAVKQQRGIVPLGNECYIVLWGNVQAVVPWDGQGATDALLPGHPTRPAGRWSSCGMGPRCGSASSRARSSVATARGSRGARSIAR